LCSEAAIDAGIDTFAAMFDIQAFTAFTAVTGFMLLTDGQGFTFPVGSALHFGARFG